MSKLKQELLDVNNVKSITHVQFGLLDPELIGREVVEFIPIDYWKQDIENVLFHYIHNREVKKQATLW